MILTFLFQNQNNTIRISNEISFDLVSCKTIRVHSFMIKQRNLLVGYDTDQDTFKKYLVDKIANEFEN